ncbi:hypothetical protein ACFFQW_37405 [Umezawaea endophytica]|uniref:Uncharacterized protein n=1 Tax=Umezawaea endophytica TaxID=1654476 RepID=A0A9X2VZ86_9PSEU|nr:hypothetical protein [Umezawaea endophytica]MCS7484689.1 hypothetical protein [Umezawaea endophytica]
MRVGPLDLPEADAGAEELWVVGVEVGAHGTVWSHYEVVAE